MATSSPLPQSQPAPPKPAPVPASLLTPSRPGQLLLAATIDWAVVAAAAVAMARGPRLLYPALALVVAGRLYALAVLAHEAAHLGRRLRGWLRFTLEVLTSWPLATSLAAMRAHHRRHHRDTGLPTDPYRRPWLHGRRWTAFIPDWLGLLALYPWWAARTVVGVAASWLPALRPLYQRMLLLRAQATPLGERELGECLAGDRRLLPALLALAAATALWPRALLAVYFVPLAIALALNGYRFLLEHTHRPAVDRSPDSVLETTRNTFCGWLGRLLLAPHNVGYHLVHHLHPGAGYAGLPRLHAWYLANRPGHRSRGDR